MIYQPRARFRESRAHRLLQAAPLLLVSLVSIVGPSCGKVGAPVAPARFTERTSDLMAVQRGSNVFLSWPPPALGQKESSRSYVARAEIYRLTERRDEAPVLDSDDYEEIAEVIGYIDRPTIEALVKSAGNLQFTDALDLGRSAGLANTRLRYAVRYLNKRGQAATFSNTVAIEPVPGIALPPVDLKVVDERQGSVTIAWLPPDRNVDDTRPASIAGYNIYRRIARRDEAQESINSDPLTEPSFTDRSFRYQADYTYVVRALSQGATGLIESADSPPLAHKPVDRFAPSTPDPLSIASANGIISLFWPTSPEPDLVGYNVYRAESPDAVKEEWTKLNAQPLTPVTYRDDRVVIGKRYYYRVTAVDRFGNESDPSAAVSETANP